MHLVTDRLVLRPLPATAAAALPADRDSASRVLGAALSVEWPQTDLLDVLPIQAAASPDDERFGVWVMVERDTETVVGDIGFMGPPDDGGVMEIGFSVIPDRRRRGYATEAACAMVAWAVKQPSVIGIIARCESANLPSIRTLERAGFLRTGEAGGLINWRSPATAGV
jgi:ribosomal-protein-alanine N-acetyltransferase